MLQRSSDNAADSSADVAQGMASETGKKRPDGQQLGHAQGGSDYHGMGKQHPGLSSTKSAILLLPVSFPSEGRASRLPIFSATILPVHNLYSLSNIRVLGVAREG